jgi:hypothetical protein
VSLVLIPVKVRATRANGSFVVGATVRAVLTVAESDDGLVVPDNVVGVTDAAGQVTLNLWPNSRGVNGSQYRVEITGESLYFSGLISLPEAPSTAWPVELSTLINQPPYPSRPAAELAQLKAQEYMLEAKGARDDAVASAVGIADYAALRAYQGSAKSLYISGYLGTNAPSGIAGQFTRHDADTTSADNGITIIVDALGRRWKRRYDGEVNVRWGEGGDGDYAMFGRALAVSAGRRLRVPAGSYTLDFDGTNAFSPPADVELVGDGMGVASITFVPSSNSYRNLFSLANAGFTMRDLKMTVQAQIGQTLAFFNVAANSVRIFDCDLDGAITDDTVTASHTAYLFSYPENGTQQGLRVEGSDIHRFTRGVLKTNAATSIQRRLRFKKNYIYDMYVTGLTFNSPLGTMDDVHVTENSFYDTGAMTIAGASRYHVGLASVSNFRVVDNGFSGVVTESVHVEEASLNGVISVNTFEVDGTAITVLDNNIAGVSTMPQRLAITSNTIKKAGAQQAAGSYGIWLVNDATPEVPGKNVVVSTNVISGFETGIGTDAELADGCSIKANEIDNCTRGISESSSSPDVKGNTTRQCDVGIYSTVSGTFEDHTFVDCTANVDPTSRPVLLVNPTFSFSAFNVNAGTVNKKLVTLDANDRAHGVLHYSVWTETANDFATEAFEITWDGAAFTSTGKYSRQPGSLSVAPSRSGTDLVVGVFHAGSKTARLTAKFSGSVCVAA